MSIPFVSIVTSNVRLAIAGSGQGMPVPLNAPAAGERRDIVRIDHRMVDAMAGGNADAALPKLRAQLDGTPSPVDAIRRARPTCVTA